MGCDPLGNIGAGASSNDVVISYSCQSDYDVKSTGKYYQVPFTSADFKSTEETTSSSEIRADRQGGNQIRTALNAGGTLDYELKEATYDDFFQLALFNSWTDLHSKTLSDLDFSGKTITTTAGDFSEFVVGKRIYIKDSLSNDGAYKITNVTSTVLTVEDDLVTESATANVTISTTAYEAAAGDITFSTGDKSMNSTVLDFTTLNIDEDQILLIQGTSNNDKIFRVETVSANKITFYDDVVTESPVGEVIIAGSRCRNGVEKYAITIEEQKVDNEYFDYVGSMVNSCEINWATGSVISGTFEFLSKSEEINVAPAGSSSVPVKNTRIYDAVTNISTVYINNKVSDVAVSSVGLSIANNLNYQPQLGSIQSAGTTVGNCDVTGSIELYYDSADLYKEFLNQQKKYIVIPQIVEGSGYAFGINAKLTNPSKTVPGVNESCTQSYDLTGETDELIDYKVEFNRF